VRTLGTDAAGNTIVTRWNGQITMNTIYDGTSNSIMFGEKHIRPNSLRGKNEDRTLYSSGNQNNFRRLAGYDNWANPAAAVDVRPLMPPLEQAHALANSSFGGPHAGVCVFVFGDGSVRNLSLSIDLLTLTYLAHRQDGKTVSNF
jgi:hypothetical protein